MMAEKFKVVMLGKRPDGAEAYGVEINGRHVELAAYANSKATGAINVIAAPLDVTLMPADLEDYADAIKLLAAHMTTKLKPLIVAQ